MKKLNFKRRLYELRKSRTVMRRRRKTNRKPLNRQLRKLFPPQKSGVLLAPQKFVLFSGNSQAASSDIDAFFKFLLTLRETNAKELQIDMSGVKRMYADATLLFKAELSRLIEVKKTRITAIPPNLDRTNQVLKQTGIDSLLNIKIDGDPNREDVVHWRIAEGPREIVDSNLLEPIMADIESVTGMESHPVYQGIIESIANCVEHAYKLHPEVNRKMPQNPGWWVFQQVKEGILQVVVCDLGIGVRRSLPLTFSKEKGVFKKLMHIVRSAKGRDIRALLAAVEYGRSSTGSKQRGMGMRNAHKVVNDLGEGSFVMMSNTGCYIYNKKIDQSEGNFSTAKLRHSIQGTILGWRLPLKRSLSENLS